ncbi:Uncharacterised protein [Kingella denitrificans]|uniref:Uncharacterized protein n=1 Tax=Kingella denitrificans ATCC 33394 TaxID=888741 RepID=F0EWR0_9NEIS|nr:hypothetical protein [Kingella denitrificans]EGC18141.1 hypothetical protein HMPREF9098_0290 [Kingella denitrificans ATCC 33394]QQB41089.1 hypothetical protein I6I17_06020 [Kingella denitrificans]STR10950.1 Uncharacterised protein [Kingella denitrificans]
MNINSIFNNFSNFEDSIIRNIKIEYAEDGSKNFSILVYSQYMWEKYNNLWKEVEIIIKDVVTYRVHEPLQTTAQVISNGIHVIFFNELIYLEFGDFADPPQSFEEAMSSNTFVIGKSISCIVNE